MGKCRRQGRRKANYACVFHERIRSALRVLLLLLFVQLFGTFTCVQTHLNGRINPGSMYMCICVCVCVRTCVCVCARARVRVFVCVVVCGCLFVDGCMSE